MESNRSSLNIDLLSSLISMLSILYIFGPPLVGLPTTLNVGVLSAGVIGLLFYTHYKISNIQVNTQLLKASVYLITAFGLLYLYSFIINPIEVTEMEIIMLKNIAFLSISFTTVVLISQKPSSIRYVFHFFLIFIFINSLIILLQLLFPQLNKLIDIFIYDSSNLKLSDEIRFRGVMSFSGASLSIFNSLYFLILLVMTKQFSSLQRRFYRVMSVTVIVAMFFIARSGFMALAIILFSVALYKKRYIYILFGGIFFVFLTLLSYLTHAGQFENQLIANALSHSLEPITNLFFKTEKELPGTLKSFIRMIYLPNDIQTFIFGSGNFVDHEVPEGFKASDSGLIRQIHGHGILITILTWIVLFIPSSFVSSERKVFFNSLYFVLIIFHIKEPFIFKPQFFKFYSLFMFILILMETLNLKKPFEKSDY